MKQALNISPLTLTVLLGAMAALTPVSLDMYLPAMPVMVDNLGADPARGQWTLAAFLLGMAVGQLFYGRSSDKLGRRPIYFASIGLFCAASLGCALAPQIEAVIVMRFIEAVGSCGAAVISRAIIFDLLDAREGAKFLSRMVLVQGMAPILAPLAGGWISVTFGWRGVFFFLVAFAAATALAAYFLLPETRTKEARALSEGETTAASYLAVLRKWPLVQVALAGSLSSASFFTYLTSAPQLLIGTYGIPPDQFGWYFGANAIGLVACAQINRALLSHYAPDYILTRATFVTFGIGLLLLIGSFLTDRFGHWAVLVPMFLLVGSFSFLMTNAMALAQSYDPQRPGAVSAVIGSLAFIAGSITAAVSGYVFNGTATPMALIIVCCTALAAVLRVTAQPPPPAITPQPPGG